MKITGERYLTPHFKASEMRCKCRRKECDAAPMQRPFLNLLENLRVEWQKPLFPTSGARCAYWNRLQGGAPHSQHLLGNACDFWFEDPDEIEAFVALAEKCGFGGIGHGKHLVHVDLGPAGRRWLYPDK